MLPYRTSDGRYISLQMLAPDRYWPDLCKALGQPDMATDPRFVDIDARRENSHVCIDRLENIFAQRSFAQWRHTLTEFEGEWVPNLQPRDVRDDPQVQANGYFVDVEMDGGWSLPMVATPVQFDEQPGAPSRAPEHGEQTETVLLDMGLSWDELSDLKDRGVIR
jgi:crotonobetainyl-CoA:carnitine CoA-transferase CaiB-like acyl-CoA transferase